LSSSLTASDENRQLFYINGGNLVKRKLWLAGVPRVLDGNVICAIHEFALSLPWYVYVQTARAHLFVMEQF
jgi:hypothetical protein